ncbi:MAG: non-canonical purine NTP diphosphatase [Bacteroidales bacterium]
MKKKLVFATNNRNKLKEVQAMLPDYELLCLEDIGCTEEIPETADTLEGNALLKAKYVKDKFGLDCFADDTGLEVKSLNNEPGVYSARYAGEDKSSEANMDKLLSQLKDKSDRSAQFRTVIALITNSDVFYFEGIVKGEILISKRGDEGFGYDPIFRPNGYEISFAEMALCEKNKISHRARAVQALIQHLNK